MNISERKRRLARNDVVDNMNYSQICRRKTNISISQKEIEKPPYEKINHNQRYSLITTDYEKINHKNHINPKEKKFNNPYKKINQPQPIETKAKISELKNLNLMRKIINFQTPGKNRENYIYTIPQTRTEYELNNIENNYSDNRNNNKNNYNNNFIYTLIENEDEEQKLNNYNNNNINRKNTNNKIKRSYSCAERDKYKKSNDENIEDYNDPDIFIKKKAKDEFHHNFLLNNTDMDIREDNLEKNINNLFYTENNINILNTTDDGSNNIFNNNIYKKLNPKANINFFNLNMNFNVNYNDNSNKQNQRNHSVDHRKTNKNNETRFNHHQMNKSIEVKMINTFDQAIPINILNNNINLMENKENNLKYNMNYNYITKKNNKNTKVNSYSKFNLEDFLFVIHKLDSIKNILIFFIKNNTKISSKQLLECVNNIRIKTYDLFTFYMSCSFEGMPQNYLLSNKDSKNNMNYFTIIFILCLGIFYIITHKIKMTKDYQDKLLKLINLQEKSFLVLCEEIIEKNRINERNYVLNQIITEINKKNISSNYYNRILHIKILCIESYKIINDILFNLYTYSDKSKRNSQEAFMYKHFYNKDMTALSKIKIYDIEEIFYKNIFKVINLRSNYANITSVQGISKNNILKNYNPNYTDIKINDISQNKIKIPFLDFKPRKEYTLVLDLDETLISFNFIEMGIGLGKMHIRPGLEEFLSVIRDYYEIIVFTSGTKEYADTILDIIEQKKNIKYFSGRLYREHTIQIGQKYIKDLSKLGRDLSKTLIVDNIPHSFKLQRENGILIKSFFADDKNDKVLFELQRILINIFYDKIDVRKSIIKYREDILKNVSCIDDDYYY